MSDEHNKEGDCVADSVGSSFIAQIRAAAANYKFASIDTDRIPTGRYLITWASDNAHVAFYSKRQPGVLAPVDLTKTDFGAFDGVLAGSIGLCGLKVDIIKNSGDHWFGWIDFRAVPSTTFVAIFLTRIE